MATGTKPAATRTSADPKPARIAETLRVTFGARLVSALLFGSRVRGNAQPDSDYDVAVLLRDYDARQDRDRLFALAQELGPPGRPRIQLMGFPPDGLAERTTLMFNIRKEAQPLPGLGGPEIIAPLAEPDEGPTKSETAKLLEAAERKLVEARKIQSPGVPGSAARESYLAALYAARALIFEEQTLAPKTHEETHTLFHEIAVRTGRVSKEAAGVLTDGNEIKIDVDYEPVPAFSADQYVAYVDRAAEFVAAVKKLIEERR